MTWHYEISKAQVARDMDIPYGTVKKWDSPPGYVLRFYKLKGRLEWAETEIEVLNNALFDIIKTANIRK